MRSASSPSPRLLLAGRVLAACVAGAFGLPAAARAEEPALAPEGATVVVGILRSRDADVERDLEDGARLGFDLAAAAGGPRIALRRGETVGTWGTAGGSAVRLVRVEGAVALIAPPERDVSHLCLQVASKVLAPVVSTSRAPSVTQTGSPWVVRVVPRGEEKEPGLVPPPFPADAAGAEGFVAAFRARHGRVPGPWAAAGHDAARAIAAGLVASGGRGGTDLRDALRRLVAVPGATGRFDVVARGERVATFRGLLGEMARASAALVGGLWSGALVRAGC